MDRLSVEAVPESRPRVTEDRRDAYEVCAFVGEVGQAVLFEAPGEEVSLVEIRGMTFRAVLLLVGCAACWSNLFFKSFTLGFWPLP